MTMPNALRSIHLIRCGRNQLALDNYVEAIEILSEAIRLNPPCLRARIVIIEALEKLGDYMTSIGYLRKIIELYPNSAEADYARGHLESDGNRFFPPEELYSRAIAHDPSFVEAYFHRAIVYRNRNCYMDAVQDLTKCLNLDADYLEAYLERAENFCDLGRFSLAVRDLEEYSRRIGRRTWVDDQIIRYKTSVN